MVSSYEDLCNQIKLRSELFPPDIIVSLSSISISHSPFPSPLPFTLYYINKPEQWWSSRVKINSEPDLVDYIHIPINTRPVLLIWYPPQDCHEPSHHSPSTLLNH